MRATVPVDAYVAAIDAELRLRFPAEQRWELDTLYLGGGTPSRLGPEGVARLLGRLQDRVALAPDAEVTLEANPDDVSVQAVSAWRSAGVNRVSLGTQSFDDRVLSWMHRTHDAARAAQAVTIVRDSGIDNISLDLIFALPTTLERSWQTDLARAVALAPQHVSLYGLTIEHATPLGRRAARGDVVEAPEERYESEFLRAHAAMADAGFDHYEVSNFARPGRRSRHNWAYWSGAAYTGIGPAAHSFDGLIRRWNVAPYERWRRLLAAGDDPVGGSEALTDANRMTEAVYLGLRTVSGLRLSDAELRSVRPWIQAGWAELAADSRVVLRAPGWLRLDALSQSLTAARSL